MQLKDQNQSDDFS